MRVKGTVCKSGQGARGSGRHVATVAGTTIAETGRRRAIGLCLPASWIEPVEDLLGDAEHDTSVYANNRVECDHGLLKARLRPMRGLRHDRTASVVIRGQAFVQNLR